MKQASIAKARVTKLRNKLRREIANGKWSLVGTEFSRFDWVGLYGEYKFGCWFYCNLKRVRVHIYGDEAYDLPDLDATFKGESAWDDCIEWTVDRLIEMTDAVRKSIMAYTEKTRDDYVKKVFKGA